MKNDVEDRVRSICLSLPEVTERLSHGSPAFYVGKQFVMLWPNGHHDHDFAHLWCAAPPGAQHDLIGHDPKRIFRPPYVGGRGWIGVRLDSSPNWHDVERFLDDAYRCVATKRQLTLLDELSR